MFNCSATSLLAAAVLFSGDATTTGLLNISFLISTTCNPDRLANAW